MTDTFRFAPRFSHPWYVRRSSTGVFGLSSVIASSNYDKFVLCSLSGLPRACCPRARQKGTMGIDIKGSLENFLEISIFIKSVVFLSEICSRDYRTICQHLALESGNIYWKTILWFFLPLNHLAYRLQEYKLSTVNGNLMMLFEVVNNFATCRVVHIYGLCAYCFTHLYFFFGSSVAGSKERSARKRFRTYSRSVP